MGNGMQYEIVDLSGCTLDFFQRRREAVEALRAEEERKPGIASELVLMSYDDSGKRVGDTERADGLLENVSGPEIVVAGGVFGAGMIEESSTEVSLVRMGGWSGSVLPKNPESLRQLEGATDNPDREQGGMALG